LRSTSHSRSHTIPRARREHPLRLERGVLEQRSTVRQTSRVTLALAAIAHACSA
jgi:hypothetical protein